MDGLLPYTFEWLLGFGEAVDKAERWANIELPGGSRLVAGVYPPSAAADAAYVIERVVALQRMTREHLASIEEEATEAASSPRPPPPARPEGV
jgi:hypothetical protein